MTASAQSEALPFSQNLSFQSWWARKNGSRRMQTDVNLRLVPGGLHSSDAGGDSETKYSSYSFPAISRATGSRNALFPATTT